MISPRGQVRNLVDHALAQQGLQRTIQTIVPSLFSALSIIEASDLLVTLPRRVAQRNAERFGMTFQSLPVEEVTFELHAVRHVRNARNPLHIWLSDTLRRLASRPVADGGDIPALAPGERA